MNAVDNPFALISAYLGEILEDDLEIDLDTVDQLKQLFVVLEPEKY